MSPARRPRATPRGCLPWLGALLLISALTALSDTGADLLLFAPWAYGFGGRPTLTGPWVGTLTTASGEAHAVYLALGRHRGSAGQPAVDRTAGAVLDGHGRWCDARGDEVGFALTGHANRSASVVELQTYAPDARPVGLQLDRLTGAWRAPALVLRATFLRYDGRTYVGSSTDVDLARPVTVTLTRGDVAAYRAACQRLAAPSRGTVVSGPEIGDGLGGHRTTRRGRAAASGPGGTGATRLCPGAVSLVAAKVPTPSTSACRLPAPRRTAVTGVTAASA